MIFESYHNPFKTLGAPPHIEARNIGTKLAAISTAHLE